MTAKTKQKFPVILADIGGTHIRLGITQDGKDILHTEKSPVADYKALQDALSAYCTRHEITATNIAIATAAWPQDDGIWRFARQDRWEISPQALQGAGWNILYIGNDFKSSAIGAVSLSGEFFTNVARRKKDLAAGS